MKKKIAATACITFKDNLMASKSIKRTRTERHQRYRQTGRGETNNDEKKGKGERLLTARNGICMKGNQYERGTNGVSIKRGRQAADELIVMTTHEPDNNGLNA